MMLGQLLGAGLLAGVLAASPARAQFTDVSAASGADVGGAKDGGASFGDLNGDGWLDLFVNTNGRGYLLISDGGSPPTFSDETDTLSAFLTTSGQERAAVIADLNNDGYPDLARTDNDDLEIYLNGGPPDYVFGDVDLNIDETVDPDLNFEGVGAVDWDGDGWLELFVESQGPQIYENPEDGTANVTRLDPTMIGLPDGRVSGTNGGYVAVVDFDVDGNIDAAYRDSTLPTLFANEGDGTFSALASPVISTDNKGGVRMCDFDGNGLFDMFYTGGAGGGRNRIHLQTTARTFNESPTPAPSGTVIDSACGDVDNDGDIDLYIAVRGTDTLYLNRLTETGTATFEAADLGVGTTLYSECPAMADYDNDGDLDLYVNRTGVITTDTTVDPPVTTREGARNVLYRNDTDDDAYLMVEVLTAAGTCPALSRRSDIGAVGSLSGAAGWESGVRDINGGQGHGGQGSPRMHFGLPNGAGESYDLTVRFAADAYPTVTVSVVPSDLGAYQLLTVDAVDLDGDGILTTDEVTQSGGSPDADGDGVPSWLDLDSDGDGVSDADEAGDDDLCTPPNNTDGAGAPDYLEAPGIVIVDAGPDTSTADGGLLDTGSGVVDGGDASAPMLQAHGTGCVQCAASGDRGRGPTLAFFTLVICAFLARRRRDR